MSILKEYAEERGAPVSVRVLDGEDTDATRRGAKQPRLRSEAPPRRSPGSASRSCAAPTSGCARARRS
ncbi:hypothetical protein [Streptomyces rimosus]|uniref:hypothetical protein n=1 Tax=Streptomyces rimosus TaxID=1927 RepID=UPI0037A77C40